MSKKINVLEELRSWRSFLIERCDDEDCLSTEEVREAIRLIADRMDEVEEILKHAIKMLEEDLKEHPGTEIRRAMLGEKSDFLAMLRGEDES